MKLICQSCEEEFEYERKRKNCLKCVPPRKTYLNQEEKELNRKKQQVDSVKKRRKKIKDMSILYKGGKCNICGYSKCISALEFHHIDPEEKDFGIGHKGYTRSWEKVKEELDKCIMVCANCHREIHSGLIENIA